MLLATDIVSEGRNLQDCPLASGPGAIRGAQAAVIDYGDPTANDFLAVNQLTIAEREHTRRPDVVLRPPPQGDEIGDFSPVTRRFFATGWRSWSGRRDSNPRPSAWEARAQAGCYAAFSAAARAACWRAGWPAGGWSGIDQKR